MTKNTLWVCIHICVCVCVVSGNHLVQECGLDRTKLCKQCEPNTYTDLPLASYCKRCTQCIGMMSSTYYEQVKILERAEILLQRYYYQSLFLHHIEKLRCLMWTCWYRSTGPAKTLQCQRRHCVWMQTWVSLWRSQVWILCYRVQKGYRTNRTM